MILLPAFVLLDRSQAHTVLALNNRKVFLSRITILALNNSKVNLFSVNFPTQQPLPLNLIEDLLNVFSVNNPIS